MNAKTRRTHYRAALRELRKEKLFSEEAGHPYSFSLCLLISNGVGRVDKAMIEFYLFKPKKNDDGFYWWHRNDFDVRETCLLLCIEMSK
jgi:hypothetical protein